jgi:glycosyltransferase involved in cell wall biosynthesis
MRETDGLVSVIIPVFNGERLIADAVRSIRCQARDQAPEVLEIIVVDDGSTDGTVRAVAELGPCIRYLAQANRGPAAARNRGLGAAQGGLIAFLDQDDLWPPDHLCILMQALVRDASAEVAMGRTQAVLLAGRTEKGPVFEEYSHPWLAPHVGSALFRRAVFDRIGIFDEGLEACSDDLDWFLRARERGTSIALVDAVTYLFRIHEANTSRDADFRRRALLEAVTASVRRRRGSTEDA